MKKENKPSLTESSDVENMPSGSNNNSSNQNQWCFSWLGGSELIKDVERPVLIKGAKWPIGSRISISFLDGDPEVQKKVMDVAKKWIAPGMANLKFDFRNDTNKTDIRISFQYAGSWSTLGTTCKKITDVTKPTMNYGWLTKDSRDEELNRVVLHEFGHALGLTHEHLHPEGGIKWKKDQVKKDLSGPPNNWKPEVIENNMFKVYDKNETNYTSLDSASIMMYPIPKKWTKNNFSVGLNNQLSEKDKAFIRQQYP